MNLSERIIEVLEAHDINLCGEITERAYNNDGYDVELETYSPEGEDVIIALIYDGTEEDFIRQFESYAEDFNAEEHAETYINMRGKNGVPESIRDLLEDANWQKEMLMKVSRELNNEALEEDIEPITKEKFMDFMEENFTLNKRACLDLLESIFDYAEEHNHSKYNYMLEDLLGDTFDFTDSEREMLFRVE